MSDQAKITISGKIISIFPAEVYGNFEKRVMWLKENTDRYPQTFSIEFHQGDCNVLDAFNPDDLVECSINLRGRHWEKDGREGVMNTLQCWRIRRANPTTDPVKEPVAEVARQSGTSDNVGDDLPF